MEDLSVKQPLTEAPRNLEAEWSKTEQIFIRNPAEVKAKLAQMMKDK